MPQMCSGSNIAQQRASRGQKTTVKYGKCCNNHHGATQRGATISCSSSSSSSVDHEQLLCGSLPALASLCGWTSMVLSNVGLSTYELETFKVQIAMKEGWKREREVQNVQILPLKS